MMKSIFFCEMQKEFWPLELYRIFPSIFFPKKSNRKWDASLLLRVPVQKTVLDDDQHLLLLNGKEFWPIEFYPISPSIFFPKKYNKKWDASLFWRVLAKKTVLDHNQHLSSCNAKESWPLELSFIVPSICFIKNPIISEMLAFREQFWLRKQS